MYFDINKSLYEFMRTYHKKGDTLAVAHSRRKMSFPRFFKEVDRVAAGLYALGVRKGDIVMHTLPNIIQSVVVTYALSRIGAIASMIHPLLSVDEFDAAVKKQKPKVVFLSDINSRKFSQKCGGVKRIVCPYLVYGYIGLPHAKEFVPNESNGEEVAFYMHSGGTFGEPKTIKLSARTANAMAGNLLCYLDDKFNENNRMLAALPMFHAFGLCVGVHAAISSNMAAILVPRFKVKAVTKTIARYKVTTVIAVPRMVSKLLAYPKFSGDNIKSLQDVYVGGDSVSDELVHSFDKRMKECGGDGKLSPGYGLTETASVCVLTHRGDFVSGSVGNPINGVDARIVDENMRELPIGEIGELIISGDQVMNGYLGGDEEENDKVFVWLDGKRFVRTGDLCRKDSEGRLYFMGRRKRLIKISGMNVFPYEIERVARELPFVSECVAIEYRVKGKPFIKLLIEGSVTGAQKKEVVAHISRRMSHWNTPSTVECVAEFPRTRISKIDVKKLEEQYGNR
ncbi:MAG: acyl--CoA ligase [Clostridia bacterium]|nr:acyl--CoA ligase [Clostridia bacterium]